MDPFKNIIPDDARMREAQAHAQAQDTEERRRFEKLADDINKARSDDNWITKELTKQGVPPRYRGAKFGTWNKELAGSAAGWVEGESMVVLGPTGCGKTYFAAACMGEYLRRAVTKAKKMSVNGFGVWNLVGPQDQLFITAPALLMTLRGTFRQQSGPTLEDMIGKYSESAGPLIIDDLGAEKTTDWTLEALYLIIDNRYSWMRQTMVTSNLSMEQIANRLGDRIASRLVGMAKPLVMTGKDRRLG